MPLPAAARRCRPRSTKWTPNWPRANPSSSCSTRPPPASSPPRPTAASWTGPVTPPRERSILPLARAPVLVHLSGAVLIRPAPLCIRRRSPLRSSRPTPETGGATARATTTATALSSSAPARGLSKQQQQRRRSGTKSAVLVLSPSPSRRLSLLPRVQAARSTRNSPSTPTPSRAAWPVDSSSSDSRIADCTRRWTVLLE